MKRKMLGSVCAANRRLLRHFTKLRTPGSGHFTIFLEVRIGTSITLPLVHAGCFSSKPKRDDERSIGMVALGTLLFLTAKFCNSQMAQTEKRFLKQKEMLKTFPIIYPKRQENACQLNP